MMNHFRFHQHKLCFSGQWLPMYGFYSFLIFLRRLLFSLWRRVRRNTHQSNARKYAIWLAISILPVFTCHRFGSLLFTNRWSPTLNGRARRDGSGNPTTFLQTDSIARYLHTTLRYPTRFKQTLFIVHIRVQSPFPAISRSGTVAPYRRPLRCSFPEWTRWEPLSAPSFDTMHSGSPIHPPFYK